MNKARPSARKDQSLIQRPWRVPVCWIPLRHVPRSPSASGEKLCPPSVSYGRAWEPDVFIQVKNLHARPLDAGHSGQGIQKFELRGAGRGNDADPVTVLNGV